MLALGVGRACLRAALLLASTAPVALPACPPTCRTPAEQLLARYLAVEYGGLDISEHVSTLRLYASRSSSISEVGVRFGASTWALMMGLHDADGGSADLRPSPGARTGAKVHRAYDLGMFEHRVRARHIAAGLGIRYAFQQADSLSLDLEESDLLFIDTFHAYPQLRGELRRHAPRVRRYILLHDTTVDANASECVRRPGDYDCAAMAQRLRCSLDEVRLGLWPAVQEFLVAAPQWRLLRHYGHNNGLVVLERRPSAAAPP